MFQLKFQNLLMLSFGVFLSSASAFGQITISPSSAKIVADTTGSAQFQVLGISTDTPFSASLNYLPNEASGWASLSVNGTTITIQLNGDASFPQDPSTNLPLQGTYGVYLLVQVGVVTYKASLLVYLFPTDNQFLFVDSQGNDINAQNGGVTLTTSSPSQSIYILYANINANLSKMEGFQLSSDSKWLSFNPMSGQTPMQVLISANPSLAQPSPTPNEGFILVNDTGNQNQNAKLPVHFLVQGTPQLPTDGSSAGFSYGSANLNNGASGFLVQVPNANMRLSVSAVATQPIKIYARFGSDVTLDGSGVTADTASSQGMTPSLTLGPDTQPALQPGTWYIAIQSVSTQLTTGYIDANLTQASCTYSLSSMSALQGAGASVGSFTLSTQDGCTWSASSDSLWLRITSTASGTATSIIGYTCDPNAGPARTGHISVGGLTFIVTQASPQSIGPQIQSFTATPSNISYGAPATLSWSVVGAASVVIDHGIGAVPNSGTYVVTPGRTRIYTLVAQNSVGTNSSTTTVTVTGQPPSGERILTATPNPVLVTSGSLDVTALSWSAPSSTRTVELHLNAPNGPLFARGARSGTARTGGWVSDGMTFYLQDVTGGKPLTVTNTLDTVTVRVIPSGATFFSASPLYVAPGQSSGTVLLTWNAPGVKRVQIWVLSPSGAQMTGDLPSAGWFFSGNWAREGMAFYLQNSTSGSAKGDSNTISTTQVSVDPVP